MPGGIYSSGKLKGRSPLEATKLKAPSLDRPVARTTDPFVQTFADKDTSNILGALTGLVQNTAKVGTVIAGDVNDQGYRDMAAGKDKTLQNTVYTLDANGKKVPALNEDGTVKTESSGVVDPKAGILNRIFSPAYLAGHDRAGGEVMGTKFQAEALALLVEKGHLPKDQWQPEYDALRQKYVAGASISPEFQDGFLHRAMSVDAKVEAEYAVQQANLIHINTKQDFSAAFSDDVKRAVSTHLSKVTIQDGDKTRPLTEADLNTKAGYEAITQAPPEVINDMVASIRATIADRMERPQYKAAFSPQEMAEMTFATIKGYADALKLPQLYLYADIPDRHGIKPIDTYDTKGNPMRLRLINAAIEAEGAQERHYNNLTAMDDRQNKKKIHESLIALFTMRKAMGKMYGPEALENQEAFDNQVWKIFRLPGLTPEDAALAEKMQKNASDSLGHPDVSAKAINPETGGVESITDKYWRLFVQDKLSVDQILNDKSKLSFEDSGFWLDKVGRETLSRKRKSEDKDLNAWDNAKVQLDKVQHELREIYDPKIGGIEKFPVEGAAVYRRAKNLLIDKYVEYARDHGGLAPPVEDQKKMVEEVKKEIPPTESKKRVTNYKTHDDNGRLIYPPTREVYSDVQQYYTDSEKILILKKLSKEGK